MRTVLYAEGNADAGHAVVSYNLVDGEALRPRVGLLVRNGLLSGRYPRERPEGRRLFDMLRMGDVLVVRWVDRLGRDYADVTEVIRQFMARGVVIKTVINKLTFDGATQDPMQQAVRDALIAFMAAMAEANREAHRAGIAHANANEP
jgi:putative DNA-invertase from lambdoid prophage Rac